MLYRTWPTMSPKNGPPMSKPPISGPCRMAWMSPMSPYQAVLGSHIGLSDGLNWATGIVEPGLDGMVPAAVASRAMSTNRSEVGKIVIGGGMAQFPPLPAAGGVAVLDGAAGAGGGAGGAGRGGASRGGSGPS